MDELLAGGQKPSHRLQLTLRPAARLLCYIGKMRICGWAILIYLSLTLSAGCGTSDTTKANEPTANTVAAKIAPSVPEVADKGSSVATKAAPSVPEPPKIDPAIAKKAQATDALGQAILDNSGDGVKQAIKDGANVNASGPDGDPMLFMACYRGDKTIIYALLKAGAKINAKSHDGMTALDEAIAQGHTKLAAYLRSRGAKATGKGQEKQDQSPYTNNDHWDNPS